MSFILFQGTAPPRACPHAFDRSSKQKTLRDDVLDARTMYYSRNSLSTQRLSLISCRLANARTRTHLVSSREYIHFALFAVRRVISSARESNENTRASSRLPKVSLPLSLSLCPSWRNRDPIALENSNSTTNRLGTSPGIGNPESLNRTRQERLEDRACERSKFVALYTVSAINFSFSSSSSKD